MLSKDEILALSMRAGRRTKVVFIPEWGGDVRLRIVNAGEADHIDALLRVFNREPAAVTGHVRATCCAYYISDESGRRMFSDAEIDQLNAFPSDALTTIFNEGMAFNNTEPEPEKNLITGE